MKMKTKFLKIVSLTAQNLLIRNVFFSFLILTIIQIASYYSQPNPTTEKQDILELILFFYIKYIFIFIHNHFLIRQFLYKKRIKTYLISFIFYLTTFSIIGYYVTTLLKYETFIITEFLSALLITLLGLSFFIIYTWIINYIVETRSELINNQNELTFLKNQLSPHFLFNSINNLYGISLTNPLLISEKLLELSELLRYQIEAIKYDYVLLEAEIDFIQHYFSYSKNKFNNLDLTLKIEGSLQFVKIPPLLFLPLVENAIKFSLETENACVDCQIISNKNQIIFKIKNNFSKDNSKVNGTNSGLENLNNRLKIIGIKYDFNINKEKENYYTTELILWNLPLNV
jgi:sensor histidine kinase YesM